MFELSVLIPARNEMFLQRTIEDVLKNSGDRTEVIVVLDGYWPDPGISTHPRVTVIHHEVSIGQRGATNEVARVSRAKYIMKLDAHCSMDERFDAKLIEAAKELGGDVTQVPLQRNLHVFDWVCTQCGDRLYQGPTPNSCKNCGFEICEDPDPDASTHDREMVWKPKGGTRTSLWVFDSDLHFQYAPGVKTESDFTETMSLLGACFFMSRERFWELGGLDDEGHGSWGQMGTEVACKSWLSGGRVITNKRTWYAHLFRTRHEFGFPYPISGRQVSRARKHSQSLWRKNAWPKQVHSLSWLVDRFWPIRVKTGDGKVIMGWSDAARTEITAAGKASGIATVCGPHAELIPPDTPELVPDPSATTIQGIVWYTDNRLDATIAEACQRQLERAAGGLNIIAVSLAPVDFGDIRVVLTKLERGYLTMFRQILAGLEVSSADIIFFAEHDCLYHPSHFDFFPPLNSQIVYYNENVWKVDAKDGRALHYLCKQTSGLCARRDVLIEHYRKRVALVEEHGFTRKMGFEPGSHGRSERVDNLKSEAWMSEFPNIDIRHGDNLTPSRWRQDQFRNQRSCRGWREADDEIPGWSKTKGRFQEFLSDVTERRI